MCCHSPLPITPKQSSHYRIWKYFWCLLHCLPSLSQCIFLSLLSFILNLPSHHPIVSLSRAVTISSLYLWCLVQYICLINLSEWNKKQINKCNVHLHVSIIEVEGHYQILHLEFGFLTPMNPKPGYLIVNIFLTCQADYSFWRLLWNSPKMRN